MSTRVLLAYPRPSVSSPQKSPPLSILHVGEALKQARARGRSDENYEIRYWDGRYDDPPDLYWPDVVGVSSMTGYQIRGAISLLKRAKELGKRTILGGIHATMTLEQCLSEPYVDSVVLSEGEWAVIEAIHGGPKHVAHGGLKGTADHVSPVSAETLVHFKRSARTGDTVLMTSRGCPFRCQFCYIQKFFERRWQSVDLDRWKYDILYLRDHAGVRKLEHGDDWLGRWDRAREVIRFLFEAGIEYRPSLRAHQIDDDVAREMADMGIKHISVGMETASERMLKLTEKDNLPWHQVRCAEALAKHGIHPLFYWILKMPTETRAETNETLDQADRFARIFKSQGTPLTQNFYCFLPLPGTPLFDLVDQETLPKSMSEWSEFSLSQNNDEEASAAYWIGGLHYHKARGDKTDRNFPGLLRLLILPFELLASLRWRRRYFVHYRFEKWAVEWLLKWASARYENRLRTKRRVRAGDMEAMDFGVRENQPDVGARGEFLTGEVEGETT